MSQILTPLIKHTHKHTLVLFCPLMAQPSLWVSTVYCSCRRPVGLLVNSDHIIILIPASPLNGCFVKGELDKSPSLFPHALCMCEAAAVNPGLRGGNNSPDQTVADACISTAAIRVSPGKVAPLSSCFFMSAADSLTQSVWVCNNARSHVRAKKNANVHKL